jgi:hypothetical protein
VGLWLVKGIAVSMDCWAAGPGVGCGSWRPKKLARALAAVRAGAYRPRSIPPRAARRVGYAKRLTPRAALVGQASSLPSTIVDFSI